MATNEEEKSAENQIFNRIKKLSIYLRYVDILILTNDTNEINIL